MIPMKNIIACATDGAAAMIGKYHEFTAFLTKAIPHVMTINCVVHRRHLVAKNITEPLNSAMHFDIKYVDKIKLHPLDFSNSCALKMMKSLKDSCFTQKYAGCPKGSVLTVCSVTSRQLCNFWTQCSCS